MRSEYDIQLFDDEGFQRYKGNKNKLIWNLILTFVLFLLVYQCDIMSLFDRVFYSILFLFLCLDVFAQKKESNIYSDTIRLLDEVTIVANSYKEVISPQKLSGIELERLSSFSVADAIRYFSGVQIKDYGGIGGLKTIDIRSMGTNHMGVFYDGIQLGNAQNGQIDLGKFSLDNIEEISLYNGQKSEIFQSAKDFGSAGTIYLRTRRPYFGRGKNINVISYFRTGSFGLVNPSVLWEQKITDDISSSFNVESVSATGKYKFRYRRIFPDGTVAWDTTAVRQNGDIQALRLEGGLNGYLVKGKWNLKAYYYDSEKGIPGAIKNNVWMHAQRQWDRNFFTQGSFQKQLGSRYELLFNIKYANDHMRYLNPDTTLIIIDNYFRQQETYFSFANKYSALPNWDISLSADYQWNILDADFRLSQDYISAKRHSLLLAAATAFEWNQFKVQTSLLSTFTAEKSERRLFDREKDEYIKTRNTPPDKQEYTPALFLSYRPMKNVPLNFQAFYKRIFRIPTFNDLYYTDIGNTNLLPEYTNQYDIGLQYEKYRENSLFNYFRFKVDIYYNEIENKIIAIPKGSGQYRWMMMNIGYVEIRGVDMSGQMSIQLPNDFHFRTNLSYTYQKAQDFSDPSDRDPDAGSYGSQIAYIPWHNGSMVANLNWETWNLNYSFIYVGERYHNSANILVNHEQPWYTHDLTFAKTIKLNNMNVRLSAEMNNVLGQQFEVVHNYPMPGRNFKLIMKLEI